MSRSIIVVFEVVGEITNAQPIAIGRKIRQLDRLKKYVWSRPLEEDEG